MDLSFLAGDMDGTARQRAWVMQAIAASRYPYDALDVQVRVTFTMPPPDLGHPYMGTALQEDGSFLIMIEPWADDPSARALAGLPDPRSDIQTFFLQSFVHELGHVTHGVFLDHDDLRTQAAALFWQPRSDSGSGRRYGTLSDYSHDQDPFTAWADCIVEAIAECLKCACYTGRLIYANRTNWRIAKDDWGALMDLVWPSVGGKGFSEFQGTAFSPDDQVNLERSWYGPSVIYLESNGQGIEGAIKAWSTGWYGDGLGSIYNPVALIGEGMTMIRIAEARLDPDASVTVNVVTLGFQRVYPALNVGAQVVMTASGSPLVPVIHFGFEGYEWQTLTLGRGQEWVNDLWLVAVRRRTEYNISLWDHDPRLGGRAAMMQASIGRDPSDTDPVGAGFSYQTKSSIVLADWNLVPLSGSASPPYPFPDPRGGDIAVTAGAAGSIALG